MTTLTRLSQQHVGTLRSGFGLLGERVDASIAHEDIDPGDFTVSRYVEARYEGQSSRLRIPWPDLPDDDAVVASVTERFHAEHDREFGYHVPGEPVQILTVGATAVASRLAADGIRPPASTASSVPEPKARRAVVFDDGSEHHVPVFDRSALPVGKPMDGPAVIEEFDSTTLVPPGYHFEVVELGALRLRRVG